MVWKVEIWDSETYVYLVKILSFLPYRNPQREFQSLRLYFFFYDLMSLTVSLPNNVDTVCVSSSGSKEAAEKAQC